MGRKIGRTKIINGKRYSLYGITYEKGYAKRNKYLNKTYSSIISLKNKTYKNYRIYVR